MATNTQTVNLDFGFEDVSLAEIIGVDLDIDPIDLFKSEIQPDRGNISSRIISYDWSFGGAEVGLGIDIDSPSLGEIDLNYPVFSQLEVPSFVNKGSEFEIITGDEFASNEPKLTGETLNFGNLELQLIAGVEEGGFRNISLFNAFGQSLIELDDIDFQGIPTDRYPLITISAGKESSQELIDDIELTFGTPDGAENSVSGNKSNLSNGLETLDLSVSEPLISVVTNPLELIAKIPQLKPLDALQEDIQKEFTVLGEEYEFSAEYTVLGTELSGGYGINQDFTFSPGDVKVSLSINGEEKSGSLGDDFSFTTPENADEPIQGEVTYEFTGDIGVDFSLAPIGSIGFEALKGSISLNEVASDDVIDAQLGPVFSADASGASEFGSIDLFSTDPITISSEEFGTITHSFEIPVINEPPTDSNSASIIDSEGNEIGDVILTAPTFTTDGSGEYEITLSRRAGAGNQFNIAYIIDVSGSMGGQRLVETKEAYNELSQSLIDQGLASSTTIAVIPFSFSANLISPLDAESAIDQVSSFSAGGGTNFEAGLQQAINFFEQDTGIGVTNLTYFLSDGLNGGEGGAALEAVADELAQFGDVRAFGVAGAVNEQLNLVDSANNATQLEDASDLADALQASGFDADQVAEVEVFLDGRLLETFTIDQFAEESGGLTIDSQDIDGLQTGSNVSNNLTAKVILDDEENTVGATVDFEITGGDGSTTTRNGVTTQRAGAFDEVVEAEEGVERVVANNLDNEVRAGSDDNIIEAGGGNDTISPGGGDNTVDGGIGIDTVFYEETFAERGPVEPFGGRIRVGKNTDFLSNVEFIQFSDTRIDTETLTATPKISLGDTSFEEGNEINSVNLILTTSETPISPIEGQVTSIDGTAVAGEDYTRINTSFLIEPGETSTEISIELIGNLDFEEDETFTLEFSNLRNATFANDQTELEQTITIVNDDDGSPTIVSSQTVEVNENTNFVQTVRASNPNQQVNNNITFNITGGLDQDLFTIDQQTGELQFVQEPDFENPESQNGTNTYEVEVTATNNFALSDSETIAVTVTDINESPLIISDTTTVEVKENTTEVLSVNASDPDVNDTITFSLTGGEDQGLFTIARQAGTLRFLEAPNFENPASASGDNNYQVEVTAQDSKDLTDVQIININVIDFDDWSLDIDGNGKINPLSDGIMTVRFLFGGAFAKDDLINDAISEDATRSFEEITDYLKEGVDQGFLDIDGNGEVEALSDGIIAVRYLLGNAFAGEALIDGAISPDSPLSLEEIQANLADLTSI
ncbi:UNVERIFIED_CONTAM: hypothetical protein BEN50_06805 [Euhalothece sp. KZN 001]